MSRYRRIWRDEAGAVLVEATLSLPILIMLIFGALEFGNVFFAHQRLTQSVRDAARYLARTDDPFNATTARNMVIRGGPDSSGALIMPWLGSAVQVNAVESTVANPVDPQTGKSPYRGGPNVQLVTVDADVTYTDIFGFLPAIGLGSTITFRISHAERVIGD